MSAAAATFPAGFGAEWYKAVVGSCRRGESRWPAHAQAAWEYFKRRHRQAKREFSPKDREIGQEVGGCRRTIQRGLKWLQDHGIIFRDHSGGHGRVIRILLPLAGDNQAEKEAKPPRKAKGPKPAVPSAPPAPAPPLPPEDPPSPEERRSASQALRQEMERLKAEAEASRRTAAEDARDPRPAGPSMPLIRGLSDDVEYLRFKEQLGEPLTAEEREKLDQVRRRAP